MEREFAPRKKNVIIKSLFVYEGFAYYVEL